MWESTTADRIIMGIISFAFGGLGAWLATYINYKYSIKRDINKLDIDIQHFRSEIQEKRTQEVLDVVWKQFQESLGKVAGLFFGYKLFPDLNSMTDVELLQFLDDAQVDEWKKSKIIEAPNRNDMYTKILSVEQRNETNMAVNDFHNLLVRNKIYIPKELFGKLDEIRGLLIRSFGSYEMGNEVHDIKLI